MRLLLKLLVCSAFCCCCSGCFRITYRVATPAGGTYKNRFWNTYFMAGLVSVEETYEFDKMCGSDQLIEVRSYQSPANVLATILGTLTEASTVEAVCLKSPSKPPAAAAKRFPF